MAGSASGLMSTKPLVGEQGLEDGVAAIASRHGQPVRLDLIDEPELSKSARIRIRAAARSRPR